MQLQEPEDDPLSRLKGTKMVSCRICKGDHWTTKCPYKDSFPALQDMEVEKKKAEEPPPAAAAGGQPQAPTGARTGKYVPPSLRDGGNRKGDSMSMKNRGGRSVVSYAFHANSLLVFSTRLEANLFGLKFEIRLDIHYALTEVECGLANR